MTGIPREQAVATVERIVETVERERMPVPVREVWVYGDVALGLDPVERVDVYLTKDILMGGDADRAEEFREACGVDGVGETVRADWADEYPEYLRASAGGYAAPEQCLAAHLLGDEPVHLEVCNASFEDNVTQRLEGALARENYEQVLDPRGACLWVEGRRSEDAFEKLRDGEFVFPTLPDALEMLGADPDQARAAADAVEAYRAEQDGATVRGDVV
ncbi:hypothetical protein BRC95_11885 [Halobacteriales archaeon QS_5_68_33]|nr:MAG: hypothetical protein BRC95_11885 [Halobacteriales archaeon QS_5_68_33]